MRNAFLYISLPWLHDYDMQVPFCGGWKHNTTTFFFFSWTLIQSLDELIEWDRMSVLKFEEVRIHLLFNL